MKLIFFPLMLLVFASCAADIIKVEYTMSTQMGRTVLSVDADSVIVTFNGRTLPTRYARAVEDVEWKNVLISLKDVDLNSIETLQAPSDARFVDAAASASFIVTTNDSTFTSARFDGYKPNEVLVPLMDEIKKIEANNKD